MGPSLLRRVHLGGHAYDQSVYPLGLHCIAGQRAPNRGRRNDPFGVGEDVAALRFIRG